MNIMLASKSEVGANYISWGCYRMSRNAVCANSYGSKAVGTAIFVPRVQ